MADEDLNFAVIGIRAEEFRCCTCFLVLHRRLHAGTRQRARHLPRLCLTLTPASPAAGGHRSRRSTWPKESLPVDEIADTHHAAAPGPRTALLVAAGLEILKTAGRLYIQRTEANRAYHVAAGAVGLLVFLNLLNQPLLFAAALTATSSTGLVTDLSAGRPSAAPHRPNQPAVLPTRLRDRLYRMVTSRKARVTAHNKQTVIWMFAQLSAGASEQALTVVGGEVKWWVAGDLPVSGTRTKDQYEAALAAISAEFPGGLTYTIGGLTAEDDRVAAEVVSTGIHRNSRPYADHHHFLFTVRERKIVAVNEYLDTKHLNEFIY